MYTFPSQINLLFLSLPIRSQAAHTLLVYSSPFHSRIIGGFHSYIEAPPKVRIGYALIHITESSLLLLIPRVAGSLQKHIQ